MLRHLVLWNHLSTLSDSEKRANALRIKHELESLNSLIPEIISLVVITDPLPSSNAELLLDSAFEDLSGLNSYLAHPAHLRVARIVGPMLQDKRCFDYFA